MEQDKGVRLIVQFSGYHENGSATQVKFEILHFDKYEAEVLSIADIQRKIENAGHLSVFRTKKEIVIHQLQAF